MKNRIGIGTPELVGCLLALLLIGGMIVHKGRVAAAKKAAAVMAQAASEEATGLADFYSSGSVSIALQPDGTLVADDGTEVGNVATKTLVYDGVGHVSGILKMMNLDTNNVISLPVKRVSVDAGGIQCVIEDITTTGWNGPDPQPDPGPDDDYTVAVWMESESKGDAGAPHEFVYFDSDDPGPWSVERAFDITTSGQQLTRTESVNASGGRDAGPAYAQEVEKSDAWIAKTPRTWSATFGSLSWSGAAVWDEELGMWSPPVGPINGVSFGVGMHKGDGGVQYAQLDLAWAGVDCDFSRYHKDLGTWRFEGVGNSIEVWLNANTSAAHGVGINRPLAVDYSEFYLRDREGSSVDLLCLIASLQASKDHGPSLRWSTDPDGQSPGASPGDTVYPTAQEIREIGTFVNLAGVTGLDFRDAADSHKLITSSAQAFTVTEESIEFYADLYGHDPVDRAVILRAPGVDQTTCDLAAKVDYAMLKVAHRMGAGVFGPVGDKAVVLDDMVGTGDVASPDAGGGFAVTGDGTLYVDLPSNYETRLAAIPDENFPDGMPGCPDMTFYHKAGVWRDYDGEADQSEGVWSEGAESIYCARGYPCLRFDMEGPEATTLTVTLTGKTFTHTDNHLTDSTRQTRYAKDATAFSYTYTVDYDPAEAYAYAYLAVPSEARDPDLEVVERITIEGFGNGNWRIAEPWWTADPAVTTPATIKRFEGPVAAYTDGGITAAVGSVSRAALCDTGEGNGGHDNTVETLTLRNFDYVIGTGEAPVDLTTAYTLAQTASRITNCCDAWTASVDETEYDAATEDEDESRLSAMYSFSACAREDAAVPLLEAANNACNASLRCGKWTIATGILYAIRPDMVIGGMAQGPMVDSDGALAREKMGRPIWRRKAGSEDRWERWDKPRTDDGGYYRSKSGEVYAEQDPAAVLWDYAAEVGATMTSAGRMAGREYLHMALEIGMANPHLTVDDAGRIWLAAMCGGDIRVWVRSSPQRDWVERERAFAEGWHDHPSIIAMSTGVLMVVATRKGAFSELHSSGDDGRSWGVPI